MTHHEPATKQDINAVEKRLDAKLDTLEKRLDSKIEAVQIRLSAKIDSSTNDVRKELSEKIDSSTNDVRKELSEKIDKSTEEIVSLIQGFMVQVDDRFNRLEEQVRLNREDIERITRSIDAIEKQLEIDDDERLLMAHQLTRLHTWAEQAAKRIGVTLPTT